MGRSVPHNLKSTHQTEFVKIFNSLCGRYGRWEIWQDFITLAAIAISNTVDRSQAAEREKTYMTIAGKYKPEEMLKFSQMLQEVVIGMDFNPDQDFLGELYMALDLGNDHAGQFFTPYNVCRMMAEITGTDLQARVERDGWISVNDCACGAGALLVAFANACTRQKINYQTSVLFVAQDIDYIVGLMCYLQLSLMGCAGYVVIGDTLLHPSTALDRRGLIPRPDQNIWYTPFYFRDIWHYRRIWAQMDLLLQTDEKPAEQVTGKLKSSAALPPLPLQETKTGSSHYSDRKEESPDTWENGRTINFNISASIVAHSRQRLLPQRLAGRKGLYDKRGVRSDCKAITQDGQKQKNNSSKINGVSCQSPRLRSVLTAPLRLSSYGKTDWDLARFCSAATTYP